MNENIRNWVQKLLLIGICSMSQSFQPEILRNTGSSNRQANVIFDLGDVLISTDTLKALTYIGLFNILLAGEHPKRIFFEYLNKIYPRHPGETIAYDVDGTPLPQLFCDWLAGVITPEEIDAYVNESLMKDTDLYSRKKNIIRAMSAFLFNKAHYFARSRKLIKKGIEFVKSCKEQGFKVYILSNWDAESFAEVCNLHPEFAELFDGIVVSGEAHLLKPDPAIFEYALEKFNINPQDTVFIDDRPENIAAAQSLGIHGIICPIQISIFGQSGKPDFGPVERNLQLWLNKR